LCSLQPYIIDYRPAPRIREAISKPGEELSPSISTI
jgi:hypothetical protein